MSQNRKARQRRRATQTPRSKNADSGFAPVVGLAEVSENATDSSSQSNEPFAVDTAPEHTTELWSRISDGDWQAIRRRTQKFVSSFPISHQDLWVDDLTITLYASVFDNTVTAFFNRDLALSVATYLTLASQSDIPAAQRWYFAEDAVSRVSRCWEYLFQVVRPFIGMDTLAHRGVKDDYLMRAAYDVHFLPKESGDTSVVYTPIEREAALERVAFGRRELRYATVDRAARQLREEIFKRYHKVHWLVQVFDLARSAEILDLIELRNQIAHWSPAASALRMPIGGRSRMSIRFGPSSGLITEDALRILLVKGMSTTRNAIALARRAIFTADIPNRIGTEPESFAVNGITCPRCDFHFLIPVKLTNAYSTLDTIDCPNCGRDFEIPQRLEEIIVSEYLYGNLLTAHLNRYTRHDVTSVLNRSGPF